MSQRTFTLPIKTTDSYWTNPANCCKIVYSGGSSIVISEGSGSYVGSKTPRYHSLVKSGGRLPLNSYVRWDRSIKRVPGNLRTGRVFSCEDCGSYTYTNTLINGVVAPEKGTVFCEGLVANVTNTTDWDSLLLSAQADMIPDLDMLTMLAESRETIDMVLKARKTAKSLIRKALRGGKHTAKAASDAWLAWRYGWQTLGYDIQNCYELLKEPLSQKYITGQSGDSSSDVHKSVYAWCNGWEAGTDTFTYSVDASVRARCVGEVNLRTLNVLIDPAITAWELVPYSFVADWFVNVGECLSAWNARRNIQNLQTSCGVKATVNGQAVRKITGNCPPNNYVFASGTASTFETYTTKTRFPGWSPSLVPSITVRLTSKRIADAAALLLKRIL